MELDELRETWQELDKNVNVDKMFNQQQFLKMTEDSFQRKLDKINLFETLGALILVATAIYLFTQFELLDTWYLKLCGLYCLLYMLLIPLLSLGSIRNMKQIDLVRNSLKETYLKYSKARNQFLFVQQLGLYAGFLLIITVLPVSGKLLSGKDVFLESSVWMWYVPVMTLFLIVVGRWGYKCYVSATKKAAQLLKDIDEQDVEV